MKKIKKAIKWIKENYDADVYEYYGVKKGKKI
jgi:hypothetical protein